MGQTENVEKSLVMTQQQKIQLKRKQTKQLMIQQQKIQLKKKQNNF